MALSYRLPEGIVDLVQRDGLARLVTATDENGAPSQHVVYMDRSIVRSMLASEWPTTLPAEPTPQEIAAAIAARQAAAQQEQADASALRQQIIQSAQGAVGKSITAISAAERNALVTILLWKEGALTNAGVVRPLAEWVRS